MLLVFEITSTRNRTVIGNVEKVRGSVAIVGEGMVVNRCRDGTHSDREVQRRKCKKEVNDT